MLTPEQRELRRDRMGSSDSPAILGVDPWRNSHDVWYEKVFGTDETADTPAIRFGNLFEAPLVMWVAELLGVPMAELQLDVRMDHADGVLAAQFDALAPARRFSVEAKTTGLNEHWGEEGTDQVPERVIVQALHQINVAASRGITIEVVYVPVLLARFDRPALALYRVHPNERGQRAVEAAARAFWTVHVLPRVPPAQCLPNIEVLKRIRRVPKKVVLIPRALVETWEQRSDERLAAEAAEETAKAALLAALGDAEAGDFGSPTHLVTAYEQSRTGVSTKRLRAHAPQILRALAETTYFRVLRRQKRL